MVSVTKRTEAAKWKVRVMPVNTRKSRWRRQILSQ
jgi:hypothetical protein